MSALALQHFRETMKILVIETLQDLLSSPPMTSQELQDVADSLYRNVSLMAWPLIPPAIRVNYRYRVVVVPQPPGNTLVALMLHDSLGNKVSMGELHRAIERQPPDLRMIN